MMKMKKISWIFEKGNGAWSVGGVFGSCESFFSMSPSGDWGWDFMLSVDDIFVEVEYGTTGIRERETRTECRKEKKGAPIIP